MQEKLKRTSSYQGQLMKEKYGVNEIIGELDPGQRKCGQCKTFKPMEVYTGGGFLEDSCPECVSELAIRIRSSINNTKEKYENTKPNRT